MLHNACWCQLFNVQADHLELRHSASGAPEKKVVELIKALAEAQVKLAYATVSFK